MQALTNSGCPVPRTFFKCAPGNAAGYFGLQQGITLCENQFDNFSDAQIARVLRHELTHAYDFCRAKVSTNNCLHVACTEIRASALSGECSLSQELLRLKLPLTVSRHFRACVRRRATLSLEALPHCKDNAGKALDAAWNRCFSDTEPFDHLSSSPVVTSGGSGAHKGHKKKPSTGKLKSSSDLRRSTDRAAPRDDGSDSGDSKSSTRSSSSSVAGHTVAGSVPLRSATELSLLASPGRTSSSPTSNGAPLTSPSSAGSAAAAKSRGSFHRKGGAPTPPPASGAETGSLSGALVAESDSPPATSDAALLSLSRSAVTSRSKMELPPASTRRTASSAALLGLGGLPPLADGDSRRLSGGNSDAEHIKSDGSTDSSNASKPMRKTSSSGRDKETKAASRSPARLPSASRLVDSADAALQPALPKEPSSVSLSASAQLPTQQTQTLLQKAHAMPPPRQPAPKPAGKSLLSSSSSAAPPSRKKEAPAIVLPKAESQPQQQQQQQQLRRVPRRVRKGSSGSSGSGSKSRSSLRRVSKAGKDAVDAYDDGDDAASLNNQRDDNRPRDAGTASESDGHHSSAHDGDPSWRQSRSQSVLVRELQSMIERQEQYATWLQSQLSRAQLLCTQQTAVLDELVTALHSPEPSKAVSEKRDVWLTRIELHGTLQNDSTAPPVVPRRLSNSAKKSLSVSGSRLSDTSENAASGSYTGRSSVAASSRTGSTSDEDEETDLTSESNSTPVIAKKHSSTREAIASLPERLPLGTVSNEKATAAAAAAADEDEDEDEFDEAVSPRMGVMMLGSFARSSSLRQRSDSSSTTNLSSGSSSSSKQLLAKQGSMSALPKVVQRVIPHLPGLGAPRPSLANETVVVPAPAVGSAKLSVKDRRLDFSTRGRSLSMNAGAVPSGLINLKSFTSTIDDVASAASASPDAASLSGSASSKRSAVVLERDRRPSVSESSSHSTVADEARRKSVGGNAPSALTTSTTLPLPGSLSIDFATETVLLHETLGKGGSASVYRASAAGFSFACKVYHAEELNDAERAAAERDVAMMEALSHPNVLRTLGHKHARLGRLLLYVELAGGTLADSIKARRDASVGGFSAIDVLRAYQQVIAAVEYLHSRPRAIVHRDIKSENVFIDSSIGCTIDQLGSLQLKLGDFDSARYLNDDPARVGADRGALWRLKPRTAAKKRAARLSMNVGTPEFMAPEMVASQKGNGSYNEKVDVWSSGMVLFELLTLDVPYRLNHLSRFELLDAVAAGVRPTIDPLIYKDASLRKLWKLWGKLTELDPTRRFSASAGVKRVRSLIKSSPTVLH